MEFFLENPLSCLSETYPSQQPEDGDDNDDDDVALSSLFLIEKDHMPCPNYLTSLSNGDSDFTIRSDVISSFSQLSSGFNPLLPYLAINYLDRFLSIQRLVSAETPWGSRLLAASCLSLAAKMLEAEPPKSLVWGDGGLVHDSRTVRRMEFLILGALGWRMRSATPFSFLEFFTSLFKMKDPPSRQALRARAVEIILKAQNDVELLRFKPSTIAASALLSASYELFPIQYYCFRTTIFCCSYVNKEELMECYGAMQGVATEGYESVLMDEDVSDADTPINVLDQQFSTSSCSCSTSIGNSSGDTMALSSSSSSESHTNPIIKRRKTSLRLQ